MHVWLDYEHAFGYRNKLNSLCIPQSIGFWLFKDLFSDYSTAPLASMGGAVHFNSFAFMAEQYTSRAPLITSLGRAIHLDSSASIMGWSITLWLVQQIVLGKGCFDQLCRVPTSAYLTMSLWIIVVVLHLEVHCICRYRCFTWKSTFGSLRAICHYRCFTRKSTFGSLWAILHYWCFTWKSTVVLGTSLRSTQPQLSMSNIRHCRRKNLFWKCFIQKHSTSYGLCIQHSRQERSWLFLSNSLK